MTTAEFVQKFMDHTLKRKTTHGSYRVLKGDCCEVLVKSRTSYGTPNGSVIVAITFSKELTIFNDFTVDRMKMKVKRELQYRKLFTVPNEVLSYDIQNFLDSGVIELDKKNKLALIEIGDTPWLFEHDKAYEKRSERVMQYTGATKIHTRVASIKEALNHVKPTGNVCEIQKYWARAVPVGWKEPQLAQDMLDALRTPVNPFDYGFKLEDCVAKEVYNSYTANGGRNFAVEKSNKKYNHADLQGFKDAIKKWDKALEEYLERSTDEWEGIHALAEPNIPNGKILLCPEGTFMTGLVGDRFSRQRKIELNGWYKIIGKSGKVYFT